MDRINQIKAMFRTQILFFNIAKYIFAALSGLGVGFGISRGDPKIIALGVGMVIMAIVFTILTNLYERYTKYTVRMMELVNEAEKHLNKVIKILDK